MSEEQKKICESWYKILDQDYHEEDPDSGCDICAEAIELGIKDDTAPDREGDY